MSLQRELKKKRPFESLEQEAMLNIARTNDQQVIRFARLFRQHDLTPSQYNILRILRGEGAPLPSLEIANRTITVVPGITGLIDRLEKSGFVVRERCQKDRRVIYVALTEKGRKTLAELDEPLQELHKKLLGHLTKTELKELIRLLEKARGPLSAEEYSIFEEKNNMPNIDHLNVRTETMRVRRVQDMNSVLFQPFRLHDLNLRNRIVLSPMTRGRAGAARLPNRLMAEYYAQRSSAGLLITEATTISEEANGWNESPGIYTEEMTEGWKHTTNAVHDKGGVIFLQLWHTGRASHSSFHGGKPAVAPSAIKINEPYIHTPIGKQPHEVPRELETSEIPRVVEDYRRAAERAKEAGFDGVEVHGANGYLIDTFLQSKTNHRTDEYGGSVENRYRFLKEVIEAVTSVWPAHRVGVHLSPNGLVQRHGLAGLPGAVHVRRRSTRPFRACVPARRRRAGVRLPQPRRADDPGRVPKGVPRPAHGQLWLHRGDRRGGDCRRTRRPDLLRAALHQQPGPRGAVQERLAAGRTSGGIRLVLAHRREGIHGFPSPHTELKELIRLLEKARGPLSAEE